MLVSPAVMAATQSGPPGGAGMWGLGTVIVLLLVLAVLYRSLRHQLGRVDFDPEGTTDAERMRRDPDARHD